MTINSSKLFIHYYHFTSILVLLLILAFSTNILSEPLSVSASVDKTELALNQQLIYTVDLSGDGANSVADPELPDVSEFLAFLGSGGSSQSINFVNGKTSIQKSYSYHYLATKEGTFTFGPVKVLFKGKRDVEQEEYRSQINYNL